MGSWRTLHKLQPRCIFVSVLLGERGLAQELCGFQAWKGTQLPWIFFFTFLDVGIIRKYSELKLTANFKPVITALERSKESFYCIT